MIYAIVIWKLIFFGEVQANNPSANKEVYFYQKIFGHIHESPQRTSVSLTTIQCGHPLKNLIDPKVSLSPDWMYVETGGQKGFVWKKHVERNRPKCLQGEFPKFFENFNLDLSQMYYWGRLYDHMDTVVIE
jgi:hypothetical protein